MQTFNPTNLARHVVAVIFLACPSLPGMAQDPWQVGEEWIYTHEGPRPMSETREPVKGNRVHRVVAVSGEGADRRWSIRHTWGDADPTPGTLKLDGQRRLHAIEVATLLTVEFAPPVPIEWTALGPDQEQNFATTLKVMGYEAPIKYVARRLADATLETPAGKFVDCRHLEVVAHSTDQTGQPTKTRYEYWFHRDANGLVKEIFTFNYQSEGSYTGTSTLKSHTVKP